MGKAQFFGGMALGAVGIVGLTIAGAALAIHRAQNMVKESSLWGIGEISFDPEEPKKKKEPEKPAKKPKPASEKTEKDPHDNLDDEDFALLCGELEKCLDKKCEEMLYKTRDFGEAAIRSLLAYHDAMSREFQKKDTESKQE